MSSFWRFTLLGLCGAAGIGLALCVAFSNPPAGASSADALPAGVAGDAAASQSKGQLNGLKAQGRPSLGFQPIVESAQPPVAANSPIDHSTADAKQSILLAQASDGTAANQAPLSQAEVIDQLRQQMLKALQAQQSGAAAGQPALPSLPDLAPRRTAENPAGNGAPPIVPPQGVLPAPGTAASPGKSKPRITRIPGDGENNLSIHIQDSDLRDVLELLSEQGGLNILPSPAVQGKVSASLNGVDVDTALAAILRSTGFVARHDGPFIYVGTPQDFKSMEQAADSIGTRVYHINYVRSTDIQSLVTPLLTPAVGSISITPPANEGIAPDNTKAGGNQFAGGEAIVVRDYLAVLDEIDQVIAEVDRRPAQVAIEAMILRVTLHDVYSFGVDFELLRQNPDVRLATGSPLPNVGNLDFNDGGLKFAFLNGSTNAFIEALETIGDTNVIASPRLMCIDKARAEILIGQQLGYVNQTVTETATAQNVQFLEVGAQLRLRPFISSDGLIRMEVHPELSTGQVKVEGGFTLPDKDLTQVTTNIMVPDGATVIIGGLMREDLSTDTSQVPLFGSLPGIGFLFRHKKETTQKEEIIVLITPHIVCDADAACEGDKSAAEFHRRQAVYADQMSHIAKRYLGRRYYRLAQAAWARGDQQAALRFVDLSIQFDPISRAAIELRTDIWNGNLVGDHTLLKPEDFASPGAPEVIGPEGAIPEYNPLKRGPETISPGRMAPTGPGDASGRRSVSGAPRMATRGEPTLARPGGATLKSPSDPARRSSDSPAPLKGRAPAAAVNLPPDGDHPPLAERIDLTSADASNNSLDAASVPAWMVDGLMQPRATAGTDRK